MSYVLMDTSRLNSFNLIQCMAHFHKETSFYNKRVPKSIEGVANFIKNGEVAN